MTSMYSYGQLQADALLPLAEFALGLGLTVTSLVQARGVGMGAGVSLAPGVDGTY